MYLGTLDTGGIQYDGFVFTSLAKTRAAAMNLLAEGFCRNLTANSAEGFDLVEYLALAVSDDWESATAADLPALKMAVLEWYGASVTRITVGAVLVDGEVI